MSPIVLNQEQIPTARGGVALFLQRKLLSTTQDLRLNFSRTMATAERIKSLIRSFSSDDDRFYTTALQVAAHEAEQGHGVLAHEIREIIDRARKAKASAVVLDFPSELSGLVRPESTEVPFSALVLPTDLVHKIRRISHEYR